MSIISNIFDHNGKLSADVKGQERSHVAKVTNFLRSFKPKINI